MRGQDMLHDLTFIERLVFAIAHDDLSVADHRLHIAGAGIVDQAGRDAVQRQVMRPAQVDQDDIRQFSRFQSAQVVALSINARAIAGCDGQGLGDGQVFGIRR